MGKGRSDPDPENIPCKAFQSRHYSLVNKILQRSGTSPHGACLKYLNSLLTRGKYMLYRLYGLSWCFITHSFMQITEKVKTDCCSSVPSQVMNRSSGGSTAGLHTQLQRLSKLHLTDVVFYPSGYA